jgi:hypothetical protein
MPVPLLQPGRQLFLLGVAPMFSVVLVYKSATEYSPELAVCSNSGMSSYYEVLDHIGNYRSSLTVSSPSE